MCACICIYIYNGLSVKSSILCCSAVCLRWGIFCEMLTLLSKIFAAPWCKQPALPVPDERIQYSKLWFNAHRRIEPLVTENSSTVIASPNCGLWERQSNDYRVSRDCRHSPSDIGEFERFQEDHCHWPFIIFGTLCHSFRCLATEGKGVELALWHRRKDGQHLYICA